MTTLAPARCVTCGAEFRSRKREAGRPEQRHCSRQCWLRRHNSPERNRQAARKGAAKNRAAQLDRGEGKTYRKHHGRHEHRVVAERKLARPLRPGEVVHYINGDKRDNRPENLHVFASQAEHAAHHRRLQLQSEGVI